MKTSLMDLNEHLFAQLDRLSADDLSSDDLEREVKRAEAIVGVSEKVLRIADSSLKAAKLYGEYGAPVLEHLPLISSQKSSEAVSGE